MERKEEQIAFFLLKISDLIQKDQFSEATTLITDFLERHPEWIDDRFRIEMQLLTRQMENRTALKEFADMRMLSMTYQYCEQKFAWVGEKIEIQDSKRLFPDADTIWCCWLQGWDKAPLIVRICAHSLQLLDKKIVFLDKTNLNEYVQLPEYVEKKYQEGVIGNAHYSDLIRLELLTQRGGTWIDATVLITGKERIGDILKDEPLFMYRAAHPSDTISFDTWLIHSTHPSCILESTKQMLYAYWEQENEALHYFIFNLFLTIACKQYPKEKNTIPLFSNEPCHVLQHDFLHQYSQKRWHQIIGMTDVHKLTYRFDTDKTEGTFWGKLMKKLSE